MLTFNFCFYSCSFQSESFCLILPVIEAEVGEAERNIFCWLRRKTIFVGLLVDILPSATWNSFKEYRESIMSRICLEPKDVHIKSGT